MRKRELEKFRKILNRQRNQLIGNAAKALSGDVHLDPDDFPDEIDASSSEVGLAFIGRLRERERGLLPSFTKEEATHVVYKEVRYHHILRNLLRKSPDVRLVVCVRNPLSVINSWLRAPREFRTDLGWEEREEWRYAPKKNLNRPEEFFGYERWKEATRIFQALKDQHPERVHVLEYRKLLADPEAEVAGLFAFCSLEVGEQKARSGATRRRRT